ncbi:MAG: Gfo/Idh/MocA family oxidoreductase [Eubacteriales bacterium]|nr:Gfo/Idh/MocA family oxidoreductase [Eubacteriales bacterium]
MTPELTRWCFIGTGTLAKPIAEILTKSDHHQVTSVYTRTFEKGQAFAATYGATAYPTLEEAVSAPDVDAVYIVTPHNNHFQSAKTALLLGKPVLLEKPFTMTAAEAKELFALAERQNLYLAEAMWTWFSPIANQVKTWLDAGEFGDLEDVRINHKVNILKYAPRVTDPNRAGGAILDTGVYPLTFAYRLFGQPETLVCEGELADGIDLQETVTLTWKNGLTVPIGVSIATDKYLEEIYLKGTKAKMLLEHFHGAESVTLERADGTTETVTAKDLYLNEFNLAAEEFRSGKLTSSYVPKEATIAVMELIDECRRQMNLVYPFERS